MYTGTVPDESPNGHSRREGTQQRSGGENQCGNDEQRAATENVCKASTEECAEGCTGKNAADDDLQLEVRQRKVIAKEEFGAGDYTRVVSKQQASQTSKGRGQVDEVLGTRVSF
jgi:hypothetical protein